MTIHGAPHLERVALRLSVSQAVRIVVVPLVIACLLSIYFVVGWHRMESACTQDAKFQQIFLAPDYRWSWHPLGFQCTFEGKTRTSLWF